MHRFGKRIGYNDQISALFFRAFAHIEQWYRILRHDHQCVHTFHQHIFNAGHLGG